MNFFIEITKNSTLTDFRPVEYLALSLHSLINVQLAKKIIIR